ncbi:ROK family protein [Cohnella fermenti]|uniref:ROK family protein n=1 Tax=Cohnella fermenti TaxID=2565925 RepID=A0A4S4BMW4_9BACL|nr:ROK family protein [Cohnella fermenti]THF73801.1 ROK family protein [Cohnella fermenti]
MTLLAGIDIGGTKCAVSLGVHQGGERPDLIGKLQCPTPGKPEETIAQLIAMLDRLLETHGTCPPDAVGISCGGPLDSARGLLLSPPNLPGWDRVDAVRPFRERFGDAIPVALQNDANACALAEWKWGAGRGCSHMAFLTFGTGMGAGLILGGRLHAGANDMAGEIGHMRMEAYGPVGYGKAGSFEGFCSGGGIAQLAATLALEKLQRGEAPAYCLSRDGLDSISARTVGEAAYAGDETALKALRLVAEQLGRGLAVLVDLLNPEAIVIGSIYGRLHSLLEPVMLESLRREALPVSLGVCRVLPSELQEQIGDYAGLSVALHALEERRGPGFGSVGSVGSA